MPKQLNIRTIKFSLIKNLLTTLQGSQPHPIQKQLFNQRGFWACTMLISVLVNDAAFAENKALFSTPQASAMQQLADKSSARAKAKSENKMGGSLAGKIGPVVRQLLLNRKYTSKAVEPTPFLRLKNSNSVQVYLVFKEFDEQTPDALNRYDIEIEVVNPKLKTIQAWLNVGQIEEIATNDNIVSIRKPSYANARSGQFNTEGDAILRSDQLRSLGFNGSGVKVGVISDGAINASQAMSSGDLPSNLTTFGSCTPRSRDISMCLSRRTCNEGTAMAEIIHDIAPQAELAVAAVGTSLEFIQRLNDLAQNFKADIIVDDLGFFGEPFFADGDLAEAVSALPENILYVSSAGNSANSHYESDFKLSTEIGIDAHDFASGDEFMGFIIPSSGYTVPILQWNDPFDSAPNDYDLIIVNQTDVVGRSEEDQSAAGVPPIEALCLPNVSASDVVNFAIIEKFAGNAKRLEIFFLASSAIEFPQARGSIFGHPATPRALAVGTIQAIEPGNDSIAFYSSQGPSRIDFPSLVSRPKPDLIGIDGVMVSGAGGFTSPFFGTSAAAPHVAGVAALLMSSQRRINAENVRQALTQGAVDLGSPGFDPVYGFGRVDAILAKSLLKPDFVIPPILMLLEK